MYNDIEINFLLQEMEYVQYVEQVESKLPFNPYPANVENMVSS